MACGGASAFAPLMVACSLAAAAPRQRATATPAVQASGTKRCARRVMLARRGGSACRQGSSAHRALFHSPLARHCTASRAAENTSRAAQLAAMPFSSCWKCVPAASEATTHLAAGSRTSIATSGSACSAAPPARSSPHSSASTAPAAAASSEAVNIAACSEAPSCSAASGEPAMAACALARSSPSAAASIAADGRPAPLAEQPGLRTWCRPSGSESHARAR
mmetsp:Transcript_22873/g.57357  ORF Transcript_22873/g.57357 Transcript_22873/m.57357 type:complete len:221 (+) Transcript_22873:211-873(+)